MKSTIKISLLMLTLVGLNVTALGQTCNINVPETAPTSRFTINGDGTVTDTQTGLMWAQCAQGLDRSQCSNGQRLRFNWGSALSETSATSDTLNRNDWRLPNIKELQSLVEQRCSDPAINSVVFPNLVTTAFSFWSATPNAGLNDAAWRVSFEVGSVVSSSRNSLFSVRLVRDVSAQ